MKRLFGVRKLLFVAPLLAVAGLYALPSIDVGAGVPADDVAVVSNCTYYNNANHTQVVGQFGYDCCNNRVAWGRKTQFYVCGGCFVCFPPPP